MKALLSHIDTCLPCYLQYHHNRDGELLLGVPVDGETTYASVREELRHEFNGADYGCDDVTDEIFDAALAEAFEGINPESFFDETLEPPNENDDGSDMCHAWFLLAWESE